VCMSSRIKAHREKRPDCGSKDISGEWVAVILETCHRDVRAICEQRWLDVLLPQYNRIRAMADPTILRLQWRKSSSQYRKNVAHRNPKLQTCRNSNEKDAGDALEVASDP